ncbi:MAG: glycerate kinase type-2 family protein [Rudaea sp.]
MSKTLDEMRADALRIYRAGLAAADPRAAVLRSLRVEGNQLRAGRAAHDLSRGRVVVVGAGKAGAPMAAAVEEVLGDRIAAGSVTVKYGHSGPTNKIRIEEAGHPLPDESGLRATADSLRLLEGLSEDDLVLCLISGGGSALFELLVPGVTLNDLRGLTTSLLRSGANIGEINTLRKHISQVKGGQLARAAAPAQVISLILSDVFGSPLDVIASGPTAPDTSRFADAWAIVEKYGLQHSLPRSILDHLEKGVRGEIPDTPKPGDPLFDHVTNIVIADNTVACHAAERAARELGYAVTLLSTDVEGEAREVGADLAGRARERSASAGPPPACLIAGGEPTVTIRGEGKGGRSQELALAATFGLAGLDRAVLLAAGTDGTDGPTDAAGAIVDGTTLRRAEMLGLDARVALEANDSYHFFEALGDLVITGPTNTNVNDLMIALVDY